METLFKFRWAVFGVVAMVVAGSGLILGKLQEEKLLSNLNTSVGFTLMDTNYHLYSLKDLPKDKLLLLILTPDGIPTNTVLPFSRFVAKSKKLTDLGLEISVVSRLDADVLKNFQKATRFKGHVLLDPSGVIGRKLGVQPTDRKSNRWDYAIVDNQMHLYWKTSSETPLLVEQLVNSIDSVKDRVQ